MADEELEEPWTASQETDSVGKSQALMTQFLFDIKEGEFDGDDPMKFCFKLHTFLKQIQKVCPEIFLEPSLAVVSPETQILLRRAGLVTGMLDAGNLLSFFVNTVISEKEQGVFGGILEHSVIKPCDFRRRYLFDEKQVSVIWPGVVLFGGLPDCQKSSILQKLLARYIRRQDQTSTKSHTSEESIEVYEVIAVGNKHKDFFWSEVPKCHNYCFASCLLHDSALESKIIHLTADPTMGIFKNRVLDKHFQSVYEELKKQKFLQPSEKTEKCAEDQAQPIDAWRKFLPEGLLVMNFWDLGIDKAILHTLSALSGYFCNCYPCLFLDLERDVPNLFSPPVLNDDCFAHPADRSTFYKWRSRIQYLLRPVLCAQPNPKLARKPTGDMNRDKSALIITVHNGSEPDSVKGKVQLLQKKLELAAEQLGISRLLDFNILVFDLTRSESYRALKSRLEERMTQEHVKFPMSWIFLRSAFYQQDEVYIEKSKYQEMAKECHVQEDEFESFLATFTASGSIIYTSHIEPLSQYVILKPFEFFRTVARIFNPERRSMETEYGVVSKAIVDETYKKDVSFYTTALTSLRLAVELEVNSIDLLSAGLFVNETTPLLYLPALRCTPPIIDCSLDALHIFFSLDVAPKSTQVSFVLSFLEVFRTRDMSIKVIPTMEDNVLQFEVSCLELVAPCRFEHIYHGDATEIRLHTAHNTPDAICQRVCDAIIAACHVTVSKHMERYHVPMKYSFAVMCPDDQDSSQPCNIRNVQYYLPKSSGTCNACQKEGSITPLLKYWAKAVTKKPIPECQRLYEDTLRIGEVMKISEHFASTADNTDLIKQFATKLKLDESYKENDVQQYGKEKIVLQMILEWERKRDLQEPARIEMGRILNGLGLRDIAATLRLSLGTST